MARTFTEEERKILRIVQADLSDSLTPYADIAKEGYRLTVLYEDCAEIS